MTSEALLKTDYPHELPDPFFIGYLIKEGILTHDSTVLDIGAGTGTYALPFGRYCREVTALEPVESCLNVLNHRSKLWGLNNIQTVCDYWETFQPTKAFDVTFSSMCPAICNTEELRRMEEMTDKTCCLIAVQRGSYEKHRKSIMAQLQIKPQGGMTTEAIHYINALYLMGRQPNVKFWETKHTCHIPSPRILEQYPTYFEIFGVPKEKAFSFLEKYLTEHAVGGFLEEEICLRQALIYWTPKN